MPATRRAPAIRLCAAALCGIALATAGCYSSPPYGYGYQSNPGFYSSPPPGVYTPGNTYPGPVINGPPGSFSPPATFPPGGTFPPGSTIPPGGMIPPGGAFPPGGVPSTAPFPSNSQPFGQPTPADPTWRSSPSDNPSTRYQPLPQPRGTAREQPVPTYNDPVPFTEDAARPRTSSPPATRGDMFTPNPTPPRKATPPASRGDMFTPNPNSREMFTPSKPRNSAPDTFPEDESPFKSGQTPSSPADGPTELVSSARVPADGPQLIGNDNLILTAAAAEPASSSTTPPEPLFAFDRDNYHWLRGTVDYDEEDDTWFVIYNLAPDENDLYQGGLTLSAEQATFAELKNGDHVLLEGRVDQQKLDRRNIPTFHVEQARVVRR